MSLNALGALLFGTAALSFIGAVSLVYGDAFTITLAAIAMLCAYVAQLSFYATEDRVGGWVSLLGVLCWLASIILAAWSGIASVWF
jgi:hypothetical protein